MLFRSKQKNVKYSQLINVIDFDELMISCQKSIEKVTTAQFDFWKQVMNQVPDLNVLHELGCKIYNGTKEAEEYWKKMCEINMTHPRALNMYGNYILEIKNDNQIGFEILER